MVIGTLAVIALILAVVSLFPPASSYPLLAVAVILLSVALFIAFPFPR